MSDIEAAKKKAAFAAVDEFVKSGFESCGAETLSKLPLLSFFSLSLGGEELCARTFDTIGKQEKGGG